MVNFEILMNIAKVISLVFYKLLYMSIIASIVGLIILILSKIFDNKLSARCKCLMWLIPIIFFMIPINRIEIQTNSNIQISSAIDKVEDAFSSVEETNWDFQQVNSSKSNTTKIVEQNLELVSKDYNFYDVLLHLIIPILWLIGCFFGIFVFVIGHINIIRKIGTTKHIKNNKINEILIDCMSKLKINRKMQVRVQKFNESPCIYGVLHPKILVSEDFIKKDKQTIRNVFMHELSHYKRKDMLTSFVLALMTILHWFNPISYIFFRKIRHEMELATDELALKQMNNDEKKRYGLTLISLLQMYENEQIGTKILCVTDDNKNMERRIRKIKLSGKLMKHRILISILVTVTLICVIIPFVIKTSNALDFAQIVNYDEEKIYYDVKQYLINREEAYCSKEYSLKQTEEYTINGYEVNSKNTNTNVFKSFIDMYKLGIRQNDDEIYVYVWALIKNYCLENQELLFIHGSSTPYKITIKNNVIVECQLPKDGAEYLSSLQMLFPQDIIEKMQNPSELVNEEQLENEVMEYYSDIYEKNYVEQPMQSSNYYEYVNSENKIAPISSITEGEWVPIRAEYKGKQIPLTDIYGTSVLNYSGYLSFNTDNTYVYAIGVYSEESMENYLHGKYKIASDNEIYLIPNKGNKSVLNYMYIDGETVIVQEIEENKYVYFKRNISC